jgi:hypothetical protein
VLGATLEYIKLPVDVSGQILTKSSIARMFMVIESAPWMLVENATVVELDGSRYAVRRTPKRGLRQLDFVFGGNGIRGHKIRLGEAGAVRQASEAVLERGAIRSGGLEGDLAYSITPIAAPY